MSEYIECRFSVVQTDNLLSLASYAAQGYPLTVTLFECARAHKIGCMSTLKSDEKYLIDSFGCLPYSPAFHWIFDERWEHDPIAASQRIHEAIKHGIPTNYLEQMFGID